MTHGSLFSGIGGFDLAAEWMGWKNKFHCEWNPFGQKVLKYYWPDAELFSDITKSDFTKYEGTIDIISGGFPCQPYSTAGLRRGKEDDRHLWPEMLRAIREVKPSWVVGENVRGLISWNGGMVFDEVQADLEAEGYEVQPFLLPACGVNAPTEGIESGLLLTPTTREEVQDLDKFKARMEKYPNGTKMPNLATQVVGMLPTPTASDATTGAIIGKNDVFRETSGLPRKVNQNGKDGSVGLGRLVQLTNLLPTPTAQIVKHGHSEKYWDNRIGKRQMDIAMWNAETNGKTSQLSPQFVMEMMGFPTDWTLLPFLNGETNQSKPEEMPLSHK